MNERTRILELLAEGRITVEEAERLLEAVRREESPVAPPIPVPRQRPQKPSSGGKARFLCILVNKKEGETVNIRVPLGLLRAGLKLKGLLPDSARLSVNAALKDKGMDFNLNDLDGKSLDEIVEILQETSIDVCSPGETVRVCCE